MRQRHVLGLALALLTLHGIAATERPGAALADGQPASRRPIPVESTDVSPVLGIHRRSPGLPRHEPFRVDIRSIDGRGNNLLSPEMGEAGTPLRRFMAPAYSDGLGAMAGVGRPGARAVTNAVCTQGEPVPNQFGASDYLWQWGQFVDHDIDLTGGADPAEAAPIPVPEGDPFFDPDGDGDVEMPFNRSLYDHSSGMTDDHPRQQMNEITAWIDGSNVYGSDMDRAAALRTLDGTGRLKTSDDDLLPFNVDGLPNAGGTSPSLFLAGDVRANEQVGLTALHTLFVREHNRLARFIGRLNPHLDDDAIYERARRIVGAEMQVITYKEFLPALLGRRALPAYRGYDPDADASIGNLFSTASYRFGHSAVSATLLRLDRHGREISAGHLPLRDAFFAPHRIIDDGGIEPILRGLAAQRCQAVDVRVVEDLRSFLFGPPGSGGFDLAALNIQRGRDHGLPSYNDARLAMGLPPMLSFAQVSSDPEVRERLAAIYVDVEEIDVWVGGLAEDPLPGAHVGELVATVLRAQFTALRDGDRFWYQRALNPIERFFVERTTLADIIRRNTGIGRELNDDVFHVQRHRRRR